MNSREWQRLSVKFSEKANSIFGWGEARLILNSISLVCSEMAREAVIDEAPKHWPINQTSPTDVCIHCRCRPCCCAVAQVSR